MGDRADLSFLPSCFSLPLFKLYMMTVNDPRFETGIHFDDGQTRAEPDAHTAAAGLTCLHPSPCALVLCQW